MAGMSVRWTPAGQSSCVVPGDQAPILDVYDHEHRATLMITPAALYTVTPEEASAARSLLNALGEFVAECDRWVAAGGSAPGGAS